MLRKFILLFVLAVSVQVWAAPVARQPVKGFHDWKSEKIQKASSQIFIIRAQLLRAKAEANRKSVDQLEKYLDQLNWNLEVARELSVTDYFILYLSEQTQADRFHQAAAKLTTKEVAELMEAYANTLSNSPSEVVVRPGVPPAMLTKLPVQATK